MFDSGSAMSGSTAANGRISASAVRVVAATWWATPSVLPSAAWRDSSGSVAVASAAAGDGERGAAGGQPDHDGVGDLVDDDEAEGPHAEPQGVAEAGAAEVEAGPVGEPGGAQVGQQDTEL